MISTLPGQALRTLMLNCGACIQEAQTCELDIKRKVPGILFISLQGNAHPIDGRPQNEVQVGPDKLPSATWMTCFLLVEAVK